MTSTNFVPAESRPSSAPIPPPPGYMCIRTVVDMIEDPFLRSVERLAYWIVRREQFAAYGEGTDLCNGWPSDLPLLVEAALERTSPWVIAMVGDLATFDARAMFCSNGRQYDWRYLNSLKKPELLELARRELAPRKVSGFETKAEIIDRVLVHRHPRPALVNADLERLRAADHAEAHRAIAIRRALLLLEEGRATVVEGIHVERQTHTRYALGAVLKPPYMNIDEAVRFLRTATAPPAPGLAA